MMIFGDPYKFAIQIDFVEDWFLEWGEDLKNDGVFHYIIQGYILPTELKYQSISILDAVNSLNVKIGSLNKFNASTIYNQDAQYILEKLENILEKILNGDETYEEYQLYDSTYLNVEENIFDKQNSWLVSTDHSEKIIFRDYKGEIQEVILEKGYCIDIMEKVITWARSYFQNEKWI
ncbi:hypothetical protein HMPREF3136_05435 [Neisseria sp. HMSC15C08]|nr:hypothetical protein HMPREF3136_05435 [Neisseria sp. HMSC15C08]